eukprot:m.207891 g.207891  ORF g.207891 m.207891 type:complete len:332 (-) comp32995_c0_seq5:41-1036(-)
MEENPEPKSFADEFVGEPWGTVKYVLRVVQLDASRLDTLLLQMLRKQLSTSFSHFQWPVVETFSAEVDLLLASALYALSVVPNRASYGQTLLNLRYSNPAGLRPSGSRIRLHFFLTILLPWIWARISGLIVRRFTRSSSVEDPARRQLYKRALLIVQRCEKITQVGKYINHVLFLRSGQYLSISDRLCGLQCVYAKELPRRISYDFVNRQLLWHGFTEFAVFILPYINIPKVYRVVKNTLISNSSTVAPTSASATTAPPSILDLQSRRCLICKTEAPWSAHISNCGHVFCYFCIGSNCKDSGDSFDCPECYSSISLDELHRYGEQQQHTKQ